MPTPYLPWRVDDDARRRHSPCTHINSAAGVTVKQLPPTPGAAGAGTSMRQVFSISGGAMELAVAQPTIQNVALLHRMALVQRRKLHEEVQVRTLWVGVVTKAAAAALYGRNSKPT